MKNYLAFFGVIFYSMSFLTAQQQPLGSGKFEQLGELLPTPNVYRTASGAPGHLYYQQRADYDIKVILDDTNQKISGEETITYYNNSPDQLEYLWVQLDQNLMSRENNVRKIYPVSISDDKFDPGDLKRMMSEFEGGFTIQEVRESKGAALPYTINQTMMRIDLPQPLKAGQAYSFNIKWWYNINNRMEVGGRSGYEYFEEDDNYLYTIAQFYPRMAVYNDVEGWQNKQFLGRGEYTLCFGNYKVSITTPADHVLAATGTLQNPGNVLSPLQRQRFEKARNSEEPVLIVTPEEALENEKSRKDAIKTWIFKADSVRDFAFACSRKFIWDAMGVNIAGNNVMAMSFYPKEGNPLWEKYSTKVVAHTLKTYSKYTVDYPYPVAISIHSKWIGMEYPMISFNGGRPESDGTYSASTKYGMISVIIHEVGHNFFPMIINSDERQWTWMDEGLNTFVQYLTEQEWDRDYPSRRGPAPNIVEYMKGDKSTISPIMSNSENLHQFGNNAYAKPATALNILRETIMGRELFDFAFKIYCNRWKFKHPSPADFFRSMEDASAVDLDWFWRGWFFTTEHVDIAIEDVVVYHGDKQDPVAKQEEANNEEAQQDKFISKIRNKNSIKETIVEKDTATRDFYNRYDPLSGLEQERKTYQSDSEKQSTAEKFLFGKNSFFYRIKFSNPGGLLMPVIVEFTLKDGSTIKDYTPAEVWRMNDQEVWRLYYFDKEVVNIELDPNYETADVDRNNNYWPAKKEPTRFQLYQGTGRYGNSGENPMQKENRLKQKQE